MLQSGTIRITYMPKRRFSLSSRSAASNLRFGAASGDGSRGSSGRGRGGGLSSYLILSQEPLQILAFLFPFILIYGFGTIRFGMQTANGEIVTVSAYKRFTEFFTMFGVGGLYLPGLALIAVLLVMHVIKGDKWRIEMGVPVIMLLEVCILAVPLLVMDQMLTHLTLGSIDVSTYFSHAALSETTGSVATFPWQTRLVLSIGAGLFEELLFRMVVMIAIHFTIVDVLRFKKQTGTMIAIIVSSLLFTFYHDLGPGGDGFQLHLAVFYFIAGLYFAGIYLVRGFGIAAGTHAIYDILVIVLLPLLSSSSNT